MAIIHVTEATGGAPNSGRMSGTAGDLYAMLKYALPLNGWAVEFDDAANFRAVFRPASGNRFRLFVADNATDSGDARLALVRGCENATGATTALIVDPFPTVAKTANTSSNWIKSSVASTTARTFDIFVGTTWVMFFVNYNGTTNNIEFHFFGDCPPAISGDPYNTLCVERNVATLAASNTFTGISSGAGLLNYNWCRSFDGTVKSTTGGVPVFSGSVFGAQGSGPAAQGGPTTGIDRVKMSSCDTGTATTTLSATLGITQRAYIPNLWVPLHNGRGSVNTRDTFTDTAYNASATFQCFTRANAASDGFLIVETTDTWSPPVG